MKTITRKTTQVVSVSLPKKTVRRLEEARKTRGQSRSAFISALIEQQAREERWQELRKLGKETAKKFNITSEDDIDRIIHEFRREQQQKGTPQT